MRGLPGDGNGEPGNGVTLLACQVKKAETRAFSPGSAAPGAKEGSVCGKDEPTSAKRAASASARSRPQRRGLPDREEQFKAAAVTSGSQGKRRVMLGAYLPRVLRCATRATHPSSSPQAPRSQQALVRTYFRVSVTSATSPAGLYCRTSF